MPTVTFTKCSMGYWWSICDCMCVKIYRKERDNFLVSLDYGNVEWVSIDCMELVIGGRVRMVEN